MVKEARSSGLTIPLVLMGYYNPFLQHGIDRLCKDSAEAGADGFIVVDLPPEEGTELSACCLTHGLSNVPLVTPTSSDERISNLASTASTFLYCVSVAGVTGARAALPTDLKEFVTKIRSHTDLPLAVGFGISTPDMVRSVSDIADGVVVGSKILKAIDAVEIEVASNADAVACDGKSADHDHASAVRDIVSHLCTGLVQGPGASNQATALGQIPKPMLSRDEETHFGKFGGQYIPETLSVAFKEIEEVYARLKVDPDFIAEVARHRRDFVGGPTPLHLAPRLTELAGGAKIWLKREDLAHTGAHKINNAIGQAILAKTIGKPRIIAETGAGQHGVATATVCAMLGLECVVYMGAVDCERQKLNVFILKTLGASVVPVESGATTLKDAINEAMRDWVTNVETTHYLIGSAIGPHPFPTIVRDFQAVIGIEARQQCLDQIGRLPDIVVACVGGGSNAIGMFHAFVPDKEVKLMGVEAAGDGVDTNRHSATLALGTPGVLHGTRTYLLQDTSTGQIIETHSISAGLDYPGVGPEHAFLKDSGRAEYIAVDDKQALEGFKMMCKTEGIIPALEPSHAIYQTMQLAKSMRPDQIVCLNLCGRGDKDMHSVAKAMGVTLHNNA